MANDLSRPPSSAFGSSPAVVAATRRRDHFRATYQRFLAAEEAHYGEVLGLVDDCWNELIGEEPTLSAVMDTAETGSDLTVRRISMMLGISEGAAEELVERAVEWQDRRSRACRRS